jgi:UPF0271 protein
MKFILDASAIISGVQMDDANEYYITAEALNEIREKNARLKSELAIIEGILKTVNPEERSVQQVKKKVEFLGEEEALSDADISILALAFELKNKGEEVLLSTDDFGIQNVAKALSINYTSIAERGIKKVLAWNYVCTGCGQRYGKNVLLCEICGRNVKRRVKR